MFTIIGGDGREYGPVTAEQVRAWITAGRANLDTQTRRAGSDDWQRLGDLPEFGGPAGAPPVIAPAAAAAPAFGVSGTELAGRGARTSAALVNAFIYFMAIMPGSMIMSREMIERNPELAEGAFPRIDQLDLTGTVEGLMWAWAGLLGAILLQAILLGARGQNIGKILVGARVVRVDNDRPAGFARAALLRFVLPVALVLALNALFLFLGFVFLVVDYAFMFREDRRCLHDLIAGTKVVRT